jgi:glycosyltransferase involved in cell wall biosynthesis
MTESDPPDNAQAGSRDQKRIIFVANGLFGEQLAGGDINLLYAIKAVVAAGWQVEFFGGRVLEHHLKRWNLPANVIFTDSTNSQSLRNDSLGGQLRLFWEFFRRFLSTLSKLRRVENRDVIYAASDYWFDVLPAVFSKARLKVAILHMQAPALREVVFQTRPDVMASRVASLHYCLSQWLALTALRLCRNKRVVVVQSLLQSALLKRGFRPVEVCLIPNGVETEAIDLAEQGPKKYDVVWIGRVHRQKGIDDLFLTLRLLAHEFPDFRALLIGNLKDALAGRVAEMGLTACVEFSGFVSGVEKYRLLKSGQVYLMPSRHEGMPIVVCEALACGLPVVAYELEMYRPFFGNRLIYVKPFDLDSFCQTTVETVRKTRAGEKLINDQDLAEFKKANSWSEVGKRLVAMLDQVKQ